MAGLEVEGLFTAALGLQAPWPVQKVDLNAGKHRIGFEVASQAKRLSCPSCGAGDQAVHDRVRRSWRHLDFFQFEAWLHAQVPRVGCTSCGKTTQVPVGIGEINLQRGQDYVSVEIGRASCRERV